MNRFAPAAAMLALAGAALLPTQPVSAQLPTPESISEVLLATPRGYAVTLPESVNLPAARQMPFRKVVLPGAQFLISDDPEYIRVPEAVAMREEVEPGRVRLYVYNVNGVQEPEEMPRRISATITNRGDGPMAMKMLRRGFPTPSGNYFHIGKTGLYDYFNSVPEETPRMIPAGTTVAIDPEMEESIVVYNDLVHGFYEFVIDQPGTVSVVQTDPDTPGPVASDRIPEPIPTKSMNAGRGKFGTTDFLVINEEDHVIDSTLGMQQIVVADGDRDPWVVGTESMSDDPAELRGNYGILYHIEMDYTTPDGRGLALVTYNFRSGGPWCGGMAASVVVGEGVHEAGVVKVPENQLNTKAAPEVVLMQIFPPVPEGETGKIELTYSPPGASCLPTPLVLIPVEMEDED